MQRRSPLFRAQGFRWLVALLALLASPAVAQNDEPLPADGDIDEIVVLGAESESSADFSAGDAVTGFGAEDLAALGAQSIADLASFTPNLEIVTSGATTPTFFIRGVGLNDFNPNSTGAVAVYQDDVAINAPAIQLGTLFDVETVNVLRGPQGTGLARNASAGAIKIYAKKPSGNFGGFLRSDFGNFGFQDYEGAVEAPIYEDMLAGRLAFRVSKRDGTLRNHCAGAPQVADRIPSPRLGGFGPGESQTSGPWSHCGEPVIPSTFLVTNFSQVPPGLEKWVNDTDNWAARGTFLFAPTLDTTFYLNAHGSRREELTRLGQSIGTSGPFCTEPGFLCTSPNPGPGVPFDRDVASTGTLGGPQQTFTTPNNGYQPRETRRVYQRLAPCLQATALFDTCPFQSVEDRLEANRALIKVANKLADDLDPRPWDGDFDLTGPTENDTWGAFVKSEIALPGALELKTTSGFDTYDRLIVNDLDFSPETLFHITTDDEAWQVYQDVSLAGGFGETGAFTWEIGGFFLHEDLDVVVNNDFGNTIAAPVGVQARDFQQETDSAGGFAAFSYDFWEDFTLDGGYRLNWEQKSFDMLIFGTLSTVPNDCTGVGPDVISCSITENWRASTGTVRLLYRFRQDTYISWRYTRGWKPGSVNATASQFTGPTVADPETIDSFEVALKGNWFDGFFGMDASLFYYAYEDYQIFTARQFLGGNPEFVLLNANDAEVYGAEVDAKLRPWQGAFWQVRFSWLESQFLDFSRRDQFLQTGAGGSPVAFKDFQASGNPLLNSPEFKVSLTAEQTFPLGGYGSFTLRYDGVWTDTTFYDASAGKGLGDDEGEFFLPEDTVAQKAFWLHNLRGTWRAPNGSFGISGWVRNLEDEPYKTFAFDGSNFQATTIYFVGDPRTYGVSLDVTF